MDEWTDGRMDDGRMDGWTDGRIDVCSFVFSVF
jgi:hypothetical protein